MIRTYQLVDWWSPQGSGSMGDMVNLDCWQWVSMEFHPYEFLEGHICAVADCNVELAICILFVVWDIYSYQGSVTASFRLQVRILLYFTWKFLKNNNSSIWPIDREDPIAMEYSTFPKALALQEPYHQIAWCHI